MTQRTTTAAQMLADLRALPVAYNEVASRPDASPQELRNAADILIAAFDFILTLNAPQTDRVREWLDVATAGAHERLDKAKAQGSWPPPSAARAEGQP